MKKYTWHKIADSAESLSFNKNNLLEIEADDKKFCIMHYEGSYYACAHKCPHAGGFMDEGYIDSTGHIVCPVHRYKFNLKNGRNTSGEGYYLKMYPVEIRAEGVFVGTENNSLFDWLK